MDHELLTLRRSMDRLFQDSLNRMTTGNRPNGNGGAYDSAQYLVPRADAWENADAVMIELALPGVDPQSVDITYEQDTLVVTGSFPRTEIDGQRVLTELPHGEFRRRFSLQVPIDVDKIDATYDNGLLRLVLPKSEAVKPRKIEVRAG